MPPREPAAANVVAHVDQSKKGEEAAVLQSNSVINRVLRPFRAGLVALAALFVAVAASVAGATTLPAGFSETTVVTGLSAPTAFAFAPDGRIFVCQQNGQLRIYTSTGSSLGLAPLNSPRGRRRSRSRRSPVAASYHHVCW